MRPKFEIYYSCKEDLPCRSCQYDDGKESLSCLTNEIKIAALTAALEELGVSCGWTEDDDGVWHTDCNNAFVFNTEGPTDNKFKVCPYCGKPLKENKPKE